MLTRRRFLFEAEGDENDNANANDNNAAENNDTAADDNADNNDDNNDDNQEDQNKEEDNNDDNKEDDQTDENNDEEENNDDDFSINDDDNNDDNNDDNGDNEDSGDTEEESKLDPDSLKAKDRELFDSQSKPEQQIKIKELKKQFGELYSNTMSLIDRFNELSMESAISNEKINKLISILLELKSMISFYILNIYDLKSYIENDIIFNRYLAIFNSIRKVINAIKNDDFSDK